MIGYLLKQKNMRWIFTFLLTLIVAGLASFLTQIWWLGVVVCFVIGFLLPPKWAFLMGFLAVFVLWLGLSFYMDMQNSSRLSAAIAQILPLGGSTILLLLLSSILGALPAGFAMWSGALLRR